MIPKISYTVEQVEASGKVFTNIKTQNISYNALDKIAMGLDCLVSNLGAFHLGGGEFGVFYNNVENKEKYKSLPILNF